MATAKLFPQACCVISLSSLVPRVVDNFKRLMKKEMVGERGFWKGNMTYLHLAAS